MERGKPCDGCGGPRDVLVVEGIEGGADQEEDQAHGSRHHPVDDQGALGRAEKLGTLLNYWNNFDGLPSKGGAWVVPIRYP